MNQPIDPTEEGMILADQGVQLDEFGEPRPQKSWPAPKRVPKPATATRRPPPEDPPPPTQPQGAKLPPKGPVAPSAAAEPESLADIDDDIARKQLEQLASDG